MIHCHQVYCTVTVQLAVLPSSVVAVTVAVPLSAAYRLPFSGSTLTTASLLLFQVTESFAVRTAFCR